MPRATRGPKTIVIRLEPELVRRLDLLTIDFDLYRTDLIEMLLEEALECIDRGDWDMDELSDEYFEEEEEEDDAQEDEDE